MAQMCTYPVFKKVVGTLRENQCAPGETKADVINCHCRDQGKSQRKRG